MEQVKTIFPKKRNYKLWGIWLVVYYFITRNFLENFYINTRVSNDVSLLPIFGENYIYLTILLLPYNYYIFMNFKDFNKLNELTHNMSILNIFSKIILIICLITIPLIPIILKHMLLKSHLDKSHENEVIIPYSYPIIIVFGGLLPLLLRFAPTIFIQTDPYIFSFTRSLYSDFRYLAPLYFLILIYSIFKGYGIKKKIKIQLFLILIINIISFPIVILNSSDLVDVYPNLELIRIKSFIILNYQIIIRLTVVIAVTHLERVWQDCFNHHIDNHISFIE